MNGSFNTWMILREGNLIVHFYDQHHQNRNFMMNKTVVGRILQGQHFLSYGRFFEGACY